MALLELLVNDVETKSVSSPLHLGNQVSNLLLGVTVRVGNLVQVQQGLVNLLLEIERCLDGVEGRGPLVGLGLGDVLEDDTSAPHVLVLDELHGVIALLVGV